MTLDELRDLMRCASPKIRAEPEIYAGCVQSALLLTVLLNKLDASWKRGYGKVKTIKGDEIGHCWIEVDDVILETNPSQVLGLDEGALAMKKGKWLKATEAKEEEHLYPEIFQPTEAGKRFYNAEAEQILKCYRGKRKIR